MNAKKRPTLGTISKTVVNRKPGHSSWFEKLPRKDQEWCSGIKKEFASGKHTITASSLCDFVTEELGVPVSYCAFRYWLRSKNS
jgi:hypothetical protein